MENKRLIWNDAARGGILLGGVSVAYLAITQWLATLQAPFLVSLGSAVLWIAKFAGCLLLMRALMKKFASANEGVTNSDSFAFGCAVAFLSALVYSVCYFAYVQFINPEFFEASMQAGLQAYSSMLDSNSRDALEEMMPKLPMLTFFVNLIYCTVFGIIVSAIFSRNIPSRNPFSEN